MSKSFIEETKEGCILRVWVQPGASRNEIVGLYGNPPRLKIKIKAPPVDGEANDEVINFLSKTLGISKGRVQLNKGLTSRSKDLLIDMPAKDIGACFSFPS